MEKRRIANASPRAPVCGKAGLPPTKRLNRARKAGPAQVSRRSRRMRGWASSLAGTGTDRGRIPKSRLDRIEPMLLRRARFFS